MNTNEMPQSKNSTRALHAPTARLGTRHIRRLSRHRRTKSNRRRRMSIAAHGQRPRPHADVAITSYPFRSSAATRGSSLTKARASPEVGAAKNEFQILPSSGAERVKAAAPRAWAAQSNNVLRSPSVHDSQDRQPTRFSSMAPALAGHVPSKTTPQSAPSAPSTVLPHRQIFCISSHTQSYAGCSAISKIVAPRDTKLLWREVSSVSNGNGFSPDRIESLRGKVPAAPPSKTSTPLRLSNLQ